jgi:fructose-1,6-bisphosphatase I
MTMPARGTYYSCNEANAEFFPGHYRDYLHELRTHGNGKAYSSRYIGSLVADFHRTLLKGGVFLYPPTASHPSGKLRLLYEANPLALIAEQAGGMATNGREPVLGLQPCGIHQRTPLVIGGQYEVDAFLAITAKSQATVEVIT